MKTLIVDDSSFMRMQVKSMVEGTGVEIVGEAENGKQAVEKHGSLSPELILMDITMPEMDGLEALKAIKKVDKDVKVIMCSAMGQQNMIVDAIHSGASDFVVKPFDQSRVKEAIEKVKG